MDNSFLRLKNNFLEAINQNASKVIDLNYVGQVQLLPKETYLQITNSDVALNFSNLKVELVDQCDNLVKDVTNQVFWETFLDSNGIRQIVWEFITVDDFDTKPLSLRFTEETSGDIFWTNLFLLTDYEQELTVRLDYKNTGDHYGTQYSRADYYQSIRLSAYYANPINESERQEYHQISTDITVSTRNIKKRKDRFILNEFDHFTVERLEDIITSSELYVDGKRYFSSTPIDFVDNEGDSNLFEGEMLLNPTDQTYAFTYQIFEGLNAESYSPFGLYLTGTTFEDFGYIIEFNQPVDVGNGSISIYQENGTLIRTLSTDTAEKVNDYQIGWNVTAFPELETPTDGKYYVLATEGVASFLGILSEQITNNEVWTFELTAGDYSSADYSNDYFTN